MLRDVNIKDIWDGRFYGPDDRVRIGCNDCAGCSDCCRNTGDTIILDPSDMYLLEKGTGKTFNDMIEKEIEIRRVDGLVLPNIMEHREGSAESEDKCPFLDKAGRCSIHDFRPGFCRLFPVGRYYVDGEEGAFPGTDGESGTMAEKNREKGRENLYKAGITAYDGKRTDRYFCYFVQRNECTKKDSPRYKVKLRDWLGIPALEPYEDYIVRWHFFTKDVSAKLNMLKDEARDPIARYILEMFYVTPYDTKLEFYAQFETRLARVRMVMAPLGV